jgi:hypothetical protein
MPTIINHIAFVVREPERTAHLLQMLFNAKVLPPKKEGHRPPETMVSVGDIWFVLVKGEPSPHAPMITLLSQFRKRNFRTG